MKDIKQKTSISRRKSTVRPVRRRRKTMGRQVEMKIEMLYRSSSSKMDKKGPEKKNQRELQSIPFSRRVQYTHPSLNQNIR